jgi:hypothetical protein
MGLMGGFAREGAKVLVSDVADDAGEETVRLANAVRSLHATDEHARREAIVLITSRG